jgi:type I restriction enzyme S subunit
MSVKQDKSGNGLPITRIETISAGEIDTSRVGSAGLVLEECRQWMLEPGDILFSHINSAELVGKCAVYRGVPECLVHGMNLLCLRPNKSLLDSNYAQWLIRSAGFRGKLSNFVNKAVNQASVSIGNLITIPVAVPSLMEQRRIAAILDKADALRQKRRTALQKLDSLTQSIFLDMFGDPATNPKGWPITTIRELLESASYGSSEKASDTGKYPMLRMNNLTFDGRMNLSALKYIDLPAEQEERWLVREGDILFNRTNSPDLVGKTAVFRHPEPMAYAGYLVRLRVNQEATSEFISAFLNSRYGKATLRGMCKSIIGMANINATEVQTIRIPKPPVELQRTFARLVIEMETHKRRQLSSEASMDAQFSSLQHRAFRGEL